MKHIVLFGAGKSATVLIEFLLANAERLNYQLHVIDANLELAISKTKNHPHGLPYGINNNEEKQVESLVQMADLVISLLPPHLHTKMAERCIVHKKHFLNASYVTAEIRKLNDQAALNGLTFLCEMGLDPGIDHMSAMLLINKIRNEGGVINSFLSHCGGLVSPESDDNPWHYKISWNPRNIVLAGKDGASFRNKGKEMKESYAQLFNPSRTVNIPSLGPYAWYPNRDSLSYLPLYDLEKVQTFIRTTLRHPDFSFGWKNLVELKLTDETVVYDTDGMSLSAFFQIHFDRNGFSDWLQETLAKRFNNTKEYLENLINIMEAEKTIVPESTGTTGDFMMVDDQGKLMDLNLEKVKHSATAKMASEMHEANLALKQLFFLGLDSPEIINKGKCSAADVLQFILEKRLALSPDDKDMVVMMHEISYQLNGKEKTVRSHLIAKGKDSVYTAMARTVGMPLGIAALMILDGRIDRRGVIIPIYEDIYIPVLEELEKHGIRFIHEQL